jgi:hypothetical protein
MNVKENIMIAQLLSLKGDTAELVYYPGIDELLPGDVLEALESDGDGLVLQVINVASALYAGASEAALQELLEAAATEHHHLVDREGGLPDLKEVKVATAKIRRRVSEGAWTSWDGWVTGRNVRLRRVPHAQIAANITTAGDLAVVLGQIERRGGDAYPFAVDARLFDKVNVIVGNKGFGKSHSGKVIACGLRDLGAPCVIFDVNREYATLPDAIVADVGAGYALSLHEVGFGTLMSIVDTVFPMTDTARANLDFFGPRFVIEQARARRFANVQYLIDKANAGAFGGGDLVARAIADRLIKVKHMGVFAETPTKTSLMNTLMEMGEHGGILVFDLSSLRPRVQKGIASGLIRIVERFCEDEKRAGSKRYPFVFFEEAHIYIEDDDVMNLVTRMRHLGLTSFFLTNRPELLPNAVMGLVDNLIMLNLASSTDVRAVAKSVLADAATLESFAVALPPHYALITGRLTARFPVVVHIAGLPAGTPASGLTESFWDRVA